MEEAGAVRAAVLKVVETEANFGEELQS